VLLLATLHQVFSRPCISVFTYSMVQFLSWEANLFATSQGIPPISRNPNVHYRTHKLTLTVLSWVSPIQSIYPHATSWRSIVILSTHLRLGLPSGLLPTGFPTKNLYTPLLTHTRHIPSPSHSLDFITRTIFVSFYTSIIQFHCWWRSKNSSLPPLILSPCHLQFFKHISNFHKTLWQTYSFKHLYQIVRDISVLCHTLVWIWAHLMETKLLVLIIFSEMF